MTDPDRSRRVEDFDAYYRDGAPPWDIGRPQSVFQALADAGGLRGAVLDVGCGTGEHALLAAGLGLAATGVDTSPTAIARAAGKARDRGLTARFVVADALELGALGAEFDTVLDCGLFHVFTDADRARFVASLRSATVAGGTYHVLCFSENEPGDYGPRRVTRVELLASFADGWRVASIEPAPLETTFASGPAAGWHATVTRL
ncbi:SAM-dependent methyltransferase [Longispora fulva]|uniref:SAM-dependent methyltransferase n=1 Tax=Longispora fulva TaxID=619741 RepID=A0A8J7KVA1_9ACTN|nr:class I SAM-dependent methyltransferase [Longispora fulva]MBG6135047.1 SAM-dependent methyltransferase [Longispora fulva]GIG56718.1 SAM-dependent methyltransferase [Longispora fulva]